MKFDADFAKKNLFWILLGVAVPMILLAWISLATGVAGVIQQERQAAETALKNVKNFGDVKSTQWIDLIKIIAERHKKLEDEVWKEAWYTQKDLFTWPEDFEKGTPKKDGYQYQDGLFALSIKASRKKAAADNDTEPAPVPEPANGEPNGEEEPADKEETPDEEPAEQVIETINGTVTERQPEYIMVQTKIKGKDINLKIRKTEKVEVTIESDEPDQQLPDFTSMRVGDQVEVTYQRGKYFGDEMTGDEFFLYRLAYANQIADVDKKSREIPPILELVDPLKPDGTGLVQFRNWMYEPHKMPPPRAPFFNHVSEWKMNKKFSNEAWVAQEDIWIQREIYRLIGEANKYVAQFRCEGGTGKDWFHFAGEEWKLHLQLTDQNKLRATLINISPYIETVGERIFHVRVDNSGDANKNFATVKIKDDSELVPGDAFTAKTEFDMPTGVKPTGIFQVFEQVGKDNYEEYQAQGGGTGNSYYFSNPYWRFKLALNKENKLETEITNLSPIPQRVDTEFKVQIYDDPKHDKGQFATIRVQHDMIDPHKPVKAKDSPFDVKLIPGVRPTGIHHLSQVLTWEFAAIKRIDQISIGSGVAPGGGKKAGIVDGFAPGVPFGSAPMDEMASAKKAPAQSHRHITKDLEFLFKDEEEAAAAAPAADDNTAPGGAITPGDGGTTAPKHVSPNGFDFKRYSEITREARRLPVGVVLIVDQDQVGRVLAAFTNSKLRFKTTQVLMNRYPHSVRPLFERKKKTDSGFAPPGTPGFGRLPYLPPGMPGYRDPMSSGRPTAGGEERASNVELVIYGQVTLYQRYPPRPDGAITSE